MILVPNTYRRHAVTIALSVLIGATVGLSPAYAQGPTIQLNNLGLQSLRYNNTELVASGALAVGYVGFGNSMESTSGGSLQASTTYNASQQEVIRSYSWGSITTRYAVTGNRLDITISIRNQSTLPIQRVVMEPLTLRFPSKPAEYDNVTPMLRDNLSGASWLPLTSGSMRVVVTNEDTVKPLMIGLPWALDRPQSLTFPIRVNTGRESMYPSFFPAIDRPIPPGATDEYRIGLRFGSSSTSGETLAADLIARYGASNSFRVNWPDRRPIGALFLSTSDAGWPKNPRGWFLDSNLDITTATGQQQFRTGLLNYADTAITILKEMNAQGMITWDLEGQQFPHATSYVGDPTQLALIAPEMEPIADAYFKKFRDAGLKVGLTVRPQRFILSADRQSATQQEVGDPASVLISKIGYAKQRWGVSIVYIDSNGSTASPLEIGIMDRVAAAFPDVLLVPEHENERYYSITAPYHELRAGYAATPANVLPQYPEAFSVIYTADGPIQEKYNELVTAVRRGDILMFRGWFREPAQDWIRSIYQQGTNDAVPPTVAITSPGSGTTVAGTITLRASATDNLGVASVRFSIDGAQVGGEVYSDPYQVSFDTRSLSNGAHSVSATARDVRGNVGSATINFNVSNQVVNPSGPQVSITSPGAGSVVSGFVTVSASASDSAGVAGVQFKLNGNNMGAEIASTGSAGTGASFNSSVLRSGNGDNFHMTWANDDQQYVSVDDGTGWNSSTEYNNRVWRLTGASSSAMQPVFLPGYPTILGPERKWYGFGIVSISGTLYHYVSYMRQVLNPLEGARLVYSSDLGTNWKMQDGSPMRWDAPTSSNMAFWGTPNQAFSIISVLQYGRDYQDNTDGYVYLYAPNGNTDGSMRELVLARVPKNRILDRSAYEFFVQRNGNGTATWSPNITQRGVVYSFPANWVARDFPFSWIPSVVYNKALNLYVMAASGTGRNLSSLFATPSYLGIYTAPNPWGPWTQVHEDQNWIAAGDVASRPYNPIIAPKWMSADGRSFDLVYSDAKNWGNWTNMPNYKFNVQRVTLNPSTNSNGQYQVQWDTRSVGAGTHTITAVARNMSGATTTASRSVVVSNPTADTTPPNITLTSPANGSTVSGTVTLTASASDNVGVTGVQFKLGSTNLGPKITSSPYTFAWNTTAETSGQKSLTVEAEDAAGNRRVSNAVVVNVSNVSAPAPTGGLLGKWSLETSLNDSSGQGNHGAARNSLDWSTGAVGTAVNLSGKSSIEIADRGTLRPQDFTLSLWYKARNLSGVQVLLSKPVGSGTDNSFVIFLNYGSMAFHSGSTYLSRSNPPVGTWTHLAVTKQGGQVTMYLNGVRVGSANGVPTVNYDNHGIILGAEDDRNLGFGNEYFFNGELDEVHIYNRALSDAEIVSLSDTDTGNAPTQPSTPPPPAADTTAPFVQITSPASGSTASGTVSVTATATDNTGVVGVQFRLNGANLGAEDLSAPYTASWGANLASPGTYTLTALARDAAGNSTVSSPVSVTVPAPAPPPPSPTGGLLGYWPLNANLTDASGMGNNGASINGVAWTAGVAGQALSLNPSNNHAQVADRGSIRGNNFSIAFWYRARRGDGVQVMLSKPYGSGTDNSFIVFMNYGALAFHTSGGSGYVARSNAPVGTWSHVTVTKQGTSVTMYLNGVAVGASNGASSTVNYDGRPLLIGAEDDRGLGYGNEYFFDGDLDEIRFYNRVVSSDEIRNLAGTTTPSTPPPPPPPPAPTADTTVPTVQITSPAPGSLLEGTVTLRANATDNVGVVGVQFKLDGANLGAEQQAPYAMTWNSALATPGSHKLTAVARDAAGNAGVSVEVTILIPTPSVPVVPGTSGLVGYWKLDNNVTDSSGVGIHGSVRNQASWVPGVNGSAISFNGINGNVQIPGHASLDNDDFSISLWYRVRQSSGVQVLLSKPVGSGTENSFILFLNNGALAAHTSNGSGYIAKGGVLVNTWTHAVVTKQGSQMRMYVNGTLVASSNSAVTRVSYDSRPVLLGAEDDRGLGYGNEYFLKGDLDEVRIYNRPLSSSEIRDLGQP